MRVRIEMPNMWVDLTRFEEFEFGLRAVNKRSDCILPPAGKGGLLEVVGISFLCMVAYDNWKACICISLAGKHSYTPFMHQDNSS